MTILECPLCCAEIFSDVCSLENHLLDLCDNIICPICELQFKTIRTLAWHLREGCALSSNSDTQKLCDEEISPKVQEEHLKPIDAIDERGSVKEYDDKELYNFNSEDNLVNDKIDKETDDVENEEVPEEMRSLKDEADFNDVEKCTSMDSECLYSCSVCNITFTSITDHLNEYHQDENVLVDNDVTEATEGKQCQELYFEVCQQEDDSAFNTKDSSTLLWNNVENEDEIKHLMIDNWDSNEALLNSSDKNLTESKKDDIKGLKNDKKKWILTKGGFFFYKDPCQIEEFDSKNIDDTSSNVFDKLMVEEGWPENLRVLPIATFVVNSKEFNDEHTKFICENKTYVFNSHRVRLIKVGGPEESPPRLSDIPFFEKPPSLVEPVLVPASSNLPQELARSYALMWPCRLCTSLVYHWSLLARHHCTSSSKHHPCTLCLATFQTRRTLNNHYTVAHKISNKIQGCFTCSVCSANLQTSSHLEKHLAMHKKNDLVKCDDCGSMIQKSILSGHLKAHEKDGPLHLVCPSCNRPFRGESELEMHIPQCHLNVAEDLLKCSVCGTNFTELTELRGHMVLHNVPIKLHLCSFCPKSYNRLIDKIIHERVHTKSRPHSCGECGRCFRLKHSLIAHMRIHTGEKPFKCHLCEKTFRTKHLQRSHVATHAGQFQFRCKFCNKHFRTKEKVEQHESTHKKPFICIECNRIFYSLGFAKKHMENHKNKQLKFTCNLCPNMFTRAAYLEAHLRTKHGLDTLTSISISTQRTYEQMEESTNK